MLYPMCCITQFFADATAYIAFWLYANAKTNLIFIPSLSESLLSNKGLQEIGSSSN